MQIYRRAIPILNHCDHAYLSVPPAIKVSGKAARAAAERAEDTCDADGVDLMEVRHAFTNFFDKNKNGALASAFARCDKGLLDRTDQLASIVTTIDGGDEPEDGIAAVAREGDSAKRELLECRVQLYQAGEQVGLSADTLRQSASLQTRRRRAD